MPIDTQRIKAVAAALRGIRARVIEDDHVDDWSTSAYDKWIAMLDHALEANCDHLALDETQLPRDEFLMHLDAAIAFLEVYEGNQGTVTPFKPRAVE
jgi:hypothetical protein